VIFSDRALQRKRGISSYCRLLELKCVFPLIGFSTIALVYHFGFLLIAAVTCSWYYFLWPFQFIATPIADETARIVFTTLAIAADKVPVKAYFGVR
jgi:hypothetical protein